MSWVQAGRRGVTTPHESVRLAGQRGEGRKERGAACFGPAGFDTG